MHSGVVTNADHRLDLHAVEELLAQALFTTRRLHGVPYDEHNALSDQSKGAERRRRAQISRELQCLRDQCELASGLISVQYWAARDMM